MKVRNSTTNAAYSRVSANSVLNNLIRLLTSFHKLGLNNRLPSHVHQNQIKFLWKYLVTPAFDIHVHNDANLDVYCQDLTTQKGTQI